MAANDMFFWCIRAGATGDADDLFLKHNRIAVGWPRVGNLSTLALNKEQLKIKITEAYPDKKPGAVPGDAGMLFRFVCEMKQGEFVLYPSKKDNEIHVGRIIGDYTYCPDINANYPNQRTVEWVKSLPRTRFSQGALYESNSALTLFQVRNYVSEFAAALDGKNILPPPPVDPTVAIVAAQIEQNTRDFVMKQLARQLKGHPLAGFVADLLQAMGYRTRVSPEGPDGGVDIVAHRDELGLEPPIIKVQVKSTGGSIGSPEVTQLYGIVGANECGLFVTLGSFTIQAKNFAKEKPTLRLIDGNELVELVLAHYEQLDARYKGLMPLRRVYVPEPLEETEEYH